MEAITIARSGRTPRVNDPNTSDAPVWSGATRRRPRGQEANGGAAQVQGSGGEAPVRHLEVFLTEFFLNGKRYIV